MAANWGQPALAINSCMRAGAVKVLAYYVGSRGMQTLPRGALQVAMRTVMQV